VKGEAYVRQVALTLARIMAYKDEYEVARLYTDPKFMQRLREQFAGHFKLTFHLAPPLLPGRDAGGRPKKMQIRGGRIVAIQASCGPQRTARHRIRSVRLYRGAAHGAAAHR
jgi:hypothetical protein